MSARRRSPAACTPSLDTTRGTMKRASSAPRRHRPASLSSGSGACAESHTNTTNRDAPRRRTAARTASSCAHTAGCVASDSTASLGKKTTATAGRCWRCFVSQSTRKMPLEDGACGRAHEQRQPESREARRARARTCGDSSLENLGFRAGNSCAAASTDATLMLNEGVGAVA